MSQLNIQAPPPAPAGPNCVGSDRLTRGVRISVRPAYEPAQSDPESRQWIFSYHITIRNEGDAPVRLMTRRWNITDSHGQHEHVAGPGVVGKSPRIEPGASFEYSSFCPLRTHWGTMEGAYTFRTGDGEDFDAQIARFILVGPAPRRR